MTDGGKTEEKEGTSFKHPFFAKSSAESGPLRVRFGTVHVGMTDSTARSCLLRDKESIVVGQRCI